MKKQQTWIKKIVETAQNDKTALPWQRGSRRAEFATKRRPQNLAAKTA